MTVLVDADACPVKRIIVEEARRRGHYTPVPKRTPADDEAFRRALSAMLDEGKKNE